VYLRGVRVTRIVDLSIVVDARTQVYPGDPVPDLRPATRIETHGYNVLALSLGSHTGTHVDAPYHFLEDGARLGDLDLGLFVGPGVVADVRGHAPRSRLTWDELAPVADRLRPGAILAIRTGWAEERYGTPAYLDHPSLDPAACEEVLARGVRTLAIDALSPDPTGDPASGFAVHRLVLGAGGAICENLANLGAVDFPDPLFVLLPLRLGGDADGAPCRAAALRLEP
jgi:kynurenine formamidase